AAAPATGHLALLDAVLDAAGDVPDFDSLLAAARQVFAFDKAMVLRDEGDILRCLATTPSPSENRAWPASPALAHAVRGRILVLAAGTPTAARALLPPDPLLPDQPALLLPIAAGAGHAALLMRRAAGAPDFAPDDVLAARHCAIVGLAALAMRNGEK